MKFNFGHWRMLPNTEALFPMTIVNVQQEGEALVVTGYDRPVEKRGDYLDGAAITARFTSPLPNVIRVQFTHFKGRAERLPVFDLDYGSHNPTVEIGQDETTAWLKTGALTLVIPRQGTWQYQFLRDGRPLTGSEPKAVGLFQQGNERYIRDQLSLNVGTAVYGLGERFTAFVKNGQSVDIWNEDGGTDSEYAYKNVPFYLTSDGYGVLVNHPGRVAFEVASHHVNRVQFSVCDHSLDYYLFGGPTMKDALEQYTALSGRPALLPEWSFGLWLSTSFTTNYNEQDILRNIDRMAAEGIPLSVFHFDCFWMRELTWCSFLWDERNFPDPVGMLARIKAKGIKICLWINPYIAEASPLFAEGKQAGYLLNQPNGDVKQVDFWQPGIGFVDFTNPSAVTWYTDKLHTLLKMGVDCFKTDFGERIPTDVVYYNNSNPERMHNYYTYLYNQAVFNLLRDVKGDGEAVLFARSATTGGQKFPVHWGGDNTSTYPSMAETLRGGLSLGLSGFGYWSHDISGFSDTATPDLYKRWVAFGLLSSHSRLHGSDSIRVPWAFDDESVGVVRYFAQLKLHLMPYLREVAQEAHERGLPMMRPMVMEFPHDPTCRPLDMQYMLGSALLVAPIFSPDGVVTYYLPAGTWRHLLSGETRQGGGWHTEQYSYTSLPLWVHVERGTHWACLTGYSG